MDTIRLGRPTFTLSSLKTFAESFAAANLDDYVRDLTARKQPPTRKEINDSLWGTIGLTGIEVAVLDAPLLQRLRQVRQLGVAHWVYPGAVHTRFEHSLGVMHQVDRLASNINAIGGEKGHGILIEPHTLQRLRLAALFHDVGHAAYSHVSETAVAGLPGMDQLSADFSLEEGGEGKSLSEIVAYYAVRSPAARRLFEALQSKYGNVMAAVGKGGDVAIGETIDFVSSAIIGRPVDDKIPLLHELISGPYDGDKLDYFVRDAKFAGTPSVLDITRLLQKIDVRRIETVDLPSDLTKSLKVRPEGHVLFGIKWSGVAVLDEMHFARVLLYAKIYRHPRIIGIEQMMKAFAEILARVVPAEAVVRFLYGHGDEAIAAMDVDALSLSLGCLLADRDAEARVHLERAARILQDLRMRRLTSKCFQLQNRFPADAEPGTSDQEQRLVLFREQMEHPTRVVELKSEILDQVEAAMHALKMEIQGGRDGLEAAVAVHAVPKSKGSVITARAYLLPSSGRPVAYRDYVQINRGGWVESYLTDQPTGYIFADGNIADLVYLAVERLLRTSYNVLLPPSASEAAKRDAATLAALKARLSAVGFYEGTPFDVRPKPAALEKAFTRQVIEGSLVPLLAAYQAPAGLAAAMVRPSAAVRPPRPGRERHSRDPDAGANAERGLKVRRWLNQFETDQMVETALDVMRRFKMLTRQDTVTALSAFIDGNDAFRGAVVSPFGSIPDSASVQSYISADLIGPKYVSRCMGHQDLASLDRDVPIIFIDDFVGSGHQAEDILGAAFGDAALRQPLGEQRDLFASQVQDRLKAGRVAFVFTAAWRDGLGVISDAVKKIGMDALVYGHLLDDTLPFVSEGLAANARIGAFLERCRHIGSQLADAQMRPGADEREKKRTERALGYGNRAMLLASPFNVPTQTLTAVWAAGMVDGADWEPLLLRRKKVLAAPPPDIDGAGL